MALAHRAHCPPFLSFGERRHRAGIGQHGDPLGIAGGDRLERDLRGGCGDVAEDVARTGKRSYLDQLAALAGARNVFSDIAAPSAQVSLETIAARDPQWIAVLSDSGAMPAFAKRQEWRAVRAVREGHFLLLPGSLFGRPGPRSREAIRELRERIEHDEVGAQHAAPL